MHQYLDKLEIWEGKKLEVIGKAFPPYCQENYLFSFTFFHIPFCIFFSKVQYLPCKRSRETSTLWQTDFNWAQCIKIPNIEEAYYTGSYSCNVIYKTFCKITNAACEKLLWRLLVIHCYLLMFERNLYYRNNYTVNSLRYITFKRCFSYKKTHNSQIQHITEFLNSLIC